MNLDKSIGASGWELLKSPREVGTMQPCRGWARAWRLKNGICWFMYELKGVKKGKMFSWLAPDFMICQNLDSPLKGPTAILLSFKFTTGWRRESTFLNSRKFIWLNSKTNFSKLHTKKTNLVEIKIEICVCVGCLYICVCRGIYICAVVCIHISICICKESRVWY